MAAGLNTKDVVSGAGLCKQGGEQGGQEAVTPGGLQNSDPHVP